MIITQRTYVPADAWKIDAVGDFPDCAKEDLNISTEAWTILSGDKVVCIWGKLSCWDSRAIIWGVMGEGSRSCMKQIFQFAYDIVCQAKEIRLELQVRRGFEAGVRFAEMLGFERECIMRKYSCGQDAYLYARVAQ